MDDIMFCLMLLTIHERGYNHEQLIKVREKLNDMLSTAPAEYAKSDFPTLKQEAVNGWEDSLENVAQALRGFLFNYNKGIINGL